MDETLGLGFAIRPVIDLIHHLDPALAHRVTIILDLAHHPEVDLVQFLGPIPNRTVDRQISITPPSGHLR